MCQITRKRGPSEEKTLRWGGELGEKGKRFVTWLGFHPGEIERSTMKSWGGSRLEASEGEAAFLREKLREREG
jgi:hypothetical protein